MEVYAEGIFVLIQRLDLVSDLNQDWDGLRIQEYYYPAYEFIISCKLRRRRYGGYTL